MSAMSCFLPFATGNGIAIASTMPASPVFSLRRGTAFPLNLFGVQPELALLPRQPLELSFAVLLLRSGYDAVDSMDFVAMDRFQRDFWLLRQSNWQPYALQYSPTVIKQGDVTDPGYFDFIAAMQLVTTSACMADGQQTFRETCDSEQEIASGCSPNGSRAVVRDPALEDNSLLPSEWERRLGNAVYQGLQRGFRGRMFPGTPCPLPAGASQADVIDAVGRLLAVFVQQRYAMRADVVEMVGDRGEVKRDRCSIFSFCVTLERPCTFWALQWAAAHRSQAFPLYDCFAIAAYFRESGLFDFACSVDWDSKTEVIVESWTLKL